MYRFFTILIAFLSISAVIHESKAQRFPDEMRLSPDGLRLVTGNNAYRGIYDHYTINDIELIFSQSDFWDDLVDNYNDQENLPATVIINGVTFDSVGVRFKGATSYSGSNDFKKSFNISLDAYIPDQNIEGYNILNLNNCYHDPSFMGEIMYEYGMSRHAPAPKGNFAHLRINGDDWGIYANVQQVNRDLTRQWFPNSKSGTLFRAKRPEDSSAPHGTRGDSLRSLCWLGADTNYYAQHYNLKSTSSNNPHQLLMDFCKRLDTISQTHIEAELSKYLDIDNSIWFMAGEMAFVDDDSYVIKGRSDYYIYIDTVTGQLNPIEMDGNDTFDPSTHSYNIFSNVNKPKYPLLHRLINYPPYRQRYLAHLRTIMEEVFDTNIVFPRIDTYYNMIDPFVSADPVNNYTYSDFLNHKSVLKNFYTARKSYIMNHSEIDVDLPEISNTIFFSDTTAWQAPEANQVVQVNTLASSPDGIDKVTLYFGTGLSGIFQKTLMYDDGLHGDQLAGDSIYGALIPGFSGGTRIRFYTEVTSDNTPKTVAYDPPGAEHDIYTYVVKPTQSMDTSVVINEVMAKNTSTVIDSSGKYSDWIEFYNNDTLAKDISGFYLTDDPNNLRKWQFPHGTILQGRSFLIIWANDDEDSGLFNTNFNLAASGEELLFLNSNLELVNSLTFGPQNDDISLARVPNGTGNFINQTATFNFDNNIYPVIGFSAGTTGGCIPLSVNFTNTTVNASSFVWDFGDGNSSTDFAPTHTYLIPGVYTVSLSASTPQLSSTDSIPALVHAMAATPFNFSTDTIFASGATHLLSADPGYIDYQWSSNDSGQTILVDSSNIYCVVYTDTNSCKDSACVYVSLNSVGIDNPSNENHLFIFPNPAKEFLTIKTNSSSAGILEIYNNTGQLMHSTILNGICEISLKGWAEGYYMVRVGQVGKLLLIER